MARLILDHRRPRLLPALAATLFLAACGGDHPDQPIERDLAAIQQRDTLVALVTFNSTGYFIYRGEPMGFEYDLLRQFARDSDLEFRTELVRDPARLYEQLNAGDGDVVAARVVPTPSDSPNVAYTRALYTTRPATVQRSAPAGSVNAPEAVDTILQPRDSAVAPTRPLRIEARLVRRPADLAGREVTIPGRAFYEDRLVELADSLDEDITVVVMDSASYETLFRRLARGEIRLTVAPENVARLRESYYTNLLVQPVVGPTHPVVWAIRRNAPRLRQALDRWIARANADGTIDERYRTYFRDRQGYDERVRSAYLTSETGRLSQFDSLFQAAAPGIGWDWRLLAAQAFQESRFQPHVRSWAGAIGILQLMPATAREVGVADPTDPRQNVQGAVRYLEKLDRRWRKDISDPDQRLSFVLASYNAGAGHVDDARRLARKNGDDPDLWDDVAYWLLQKSRKEVYRDPVVRYGFCRGIEPVTYVSRIRERFQNYKQFVNDHAATTSSE